MNKALSCTALALVLWGCSSDSPSEPKVATSVAVTPGSVTLDAVGATRVVHASVMDQKGGAMAGVPLSWSSSSPAATVVGAGGDSAVVTAAANGTASITAAAGAASGAAAVQVTQVATVLEKVSGDQQSGTAGAALPVQVRVRVLDRLGSPVAGQSVTFTVTQGGGSLSSTTVVTGADGGAGTTWTLGTGTGTTQVVSATLQGTALGVATFSATAVAGPAAKAAVNGGNNQGAMAATALPTSPSVIVRDAGGAPLAGRTVTFAVTDGGGSVTGATVTTNASGVATVGSWILGPSAGINQLTATVAGGDVADNPVIFGAVGCKGGGGVGYAITLCYVTPMTAAQRAVFEDAAARWAGLITGDVADVAGTIPGGSCGEGSPSLDLNFDDLVIFAGIEDIDGPGSILGQAGWCYRRTASLPVLGLMQFDAADVATLQTNGQLGNVILHEMGHVLGIGSLWTTLGLLQNPSTPTSVLDTYFSGTNGVAAFNAIGGNTYTGGQKVPVENTGGAGTVNSHWRESVLQNELMTGYLSSAGPNPLSVLTVRSLADLGYTVNVAGADAFFLTLSVRAPGSPEPRRLRLENDEWKGPRYTIDRQGRRTRVGNR
ncbi:MAG TPA: leishmanolysin-related zinc metalloendopeptidase [Longimicrobium sp.]|jgi:hypothetical protein|nr:leishmanolysin-related zinc metalloendopeptidase [Longimicrobium sp.]